MELILKVKTYEILGACFEVRKQLGCGFLEGVNQEALALEFNERKIIYEKDKILHISYKGKKLEKFYVADFVCSNSILGELKALSAITSQHEAQVINYLKATIKKLDY